MADIEIGNLYDMNKRLVLEKEKELSKSKLNEAIDEVTKFMRLTEETYYMLLCHERRDYTIFKTNDTVEGCKYNATVLVNEILPDRGMILSIEKVEGAIECWVANNEEAFCYMFFPCDPCVIDEV